MRWLPTSQGTFSEYFCLDLYEKSRFQRIPQSVTYIHKQILQNECFNTALSKHRFNSVSWVRTSQRICSECFCPVIKWRYFLLHRRLQSAPNEHLQILQKDCFKSALLEVEFQSVMWIHTSQSSFWESFCLVPMGRYFHLHHRRQMSPNIHLQILQKDCFKTTLSIGRLNSVSWMHTSKSSSWERFCLVCMWRFPVYNEFLQELQISKSRRYKRSVSKLLYQKHGSTLAVECTHHYKASENASV